LWKARDPTLRNPGESSITQGIKRFPAA
jgi:hypothetical protein